MKCIALRHVAFEDLGIFGPVLEARGYRIDYRQAGIDPLADAEWTGVELVVVLGGPIGVYEADRYPWLEGEIAGLRARLSRRLPTLGICLGAQLMAAALGARVHPGPAKEIGWSGLELTQDGRSSCLAALEGAQVLHWHGDTFDLPEGAVRLASTALTPNQAFALGGYGLATQFHAEVDGAAIEAWLIGHTCELAQAGIDVSELRARTVEVRQQAACAGRRMLELWLDGLAAASGTRGPAAVMSADPG